MWIIDKSNQPAEMNEVEGFLLSLWYNPLMKFDRQPEICSAFSFRGRNSILVFISLAFIYTAGRFSSTLEHGIAFFPYRAPERVY